MVYDGGKAGAGVFQTIINQIPPHDCYIEPFLGHGAVLRHKRPAARSVGVEIDAEVLGAWNGGEVLGLELYQGCGLHWLRHEFRLNAAAAAGNGGPVLGAGNGGPAGGLSPRSGPAAPGGAARNGGPRAVTVVYADPPYPIPTRRNGAKIYRHEMTEDDHADLLDVLVSLPCLVLISSYWSEMYSERLAGWRLLKFNAQTRAGTATECLWMNFPPPQVLHDPRYVGKNKRERERIRRRARNWRRTLERIPPLERQAIIDALTRDW